MTACTWCPPGPTPSPHWRATSATGPAGGAFPSGLFVLAVAGARIHAITRFHIDELYPRFGLARSLPEAGGRAGHPAR